VRFSALMLLLLPLFQTSPAPSTRDVTPAKGFIDGVVVETGSNQPIAAAQVRLVATSSSAAPPFRPVKTDAQGRFSFLNLDRTSYAISVDAAGFSPQDSVATPGFAKTVDLSTSAFQ